MRKITASRLKNFTLCPRLPYLNIYGPEEKKLPVPEFIKKIGEAGKAFEKEVMQDMKYAMPEFEKGDWGSALKQTVGLMAKGVDIIYQGVLYNPKLFGIPDILEKRKGKSRFGNYYYVATDIKTGLSTKDKYIVQVVFYSYLLGRIQGHMPKKGYLILGDKTKHEIRVSERYPYLKENLAELRKVVKGKQYPPSRVQECSNCPWHDLCFDILLKKKDMSLLYKLSRTGKEKLQSHGIKTLKDVLHMDIDKLSSMQGLTKPMLTKWKKQAESWVKSRPIKVGAIEFPVAETEIFLDFESEDNTHYMIGVLAKKTAKKSGKEYVKQFIAHKREDERTMWKSFVEWLSKQGGFVIYHYGPYEKKVFAQLIERYGAPAKIEKKIFSSMVDLLKFFYNKVMLPVYSYSLKPVAKYLGFSWRNVDASGDLSMVWYDSYLTTGNKKYMELIKEYNEDDLIATKRVKDWLAKL